MKIWAVLVGLLASSSPGILRADFVGGDFENPVSPYKNAAVNGGTLVAGGFNSPFTFQQDNAGIINGTVSSIGNPSPMGNQAAYLQLESSAPRADNGYLSQTFTATAGNYTISLLDATAQGNSAFTIFVDSKLIGGEAVINTSAYKSYTTASFLLTGGSHTVQFTASGTVVAAYTFLDNITFNPVPNAVPEPSSVALVCTGLISAMGMAYRNRKRSLT